MPYKKLATADPDDLRRTIAQILDLIMEQDTDQWKLEGPALGEGGKGLVYQETTPAVEGLKALQLIHQHRARQCVDRQFTDNPHAAIDLLLLKPTPAELNYILMAVRAVVHDVLRPLTKLAGVYDDPADDEMDDADLPDVPPEAS